MILSLFDYSGEWSKPYVKAGYTVYRVDLLHPVGYSRAPDGARLVGLDLGDMDRVALLLELLHGRRVHGILACPPCDCWTRASAWLWKKWDEDGTSARSMRLVDNTLEIIELLTPDFWALENPPGRLWRSPASVRKSGPGLRQDVLGEPRLSFRQYEYGGWSPDDPQSGQHKATYIWGNFNIPEQKPVAPMVNQRWKKEKSGTCGNIQTMGSRNKRERERTPSGFSKAFFEANR